MEYDCLDKTFTFWNIFQNIDMRENTHIQVIVKISMFYPRKSNQAIIRRTTRLPESRQHWLPTHPGPLQVERNPTWCHTEGPHFRIQWSGRGLFWITPHSDEGQVSPPGLLCAGTWTWGPWCRNWWQKRQHGSCVKSTLGVGFCELPIPACPRPAPFMYSP